MIAALLVLLAAPTYFPDGLVSDGHPDDWIAHITLVTSLGFEAAGEPTCQVLAQEGDGFRFVVRPWDDGPIIVRVEFKSDDWIQVVTTRMAVNAEENGFVVESRETHDQSRIATRILRQQLKRWNPRSTPYEPVEDGSEVVVEHWEGGKCRSVLSPDPNFVATSLMLLGVDPDDAFASGRRRRSAK